MSWEASFGRFFFFEKTTHTYIRGNKFTIHLAINSYGLATIGDIELEIINATVQVFGGGSIADGAKLMMNNSGIFKIPSGAEFSVLGGLNIFGIDFIK